MPTIVLPPLDDRRASRPLPPIPNSHGARSSKVPFLLSSAPSLDHAPNPGVSTLRTSYAHSSHTSYMPAPAPAPLSRALQEPRILTHFLRYLQWHDFRSLAMTHTSCRDLLQHPKLRDVVLSAFVPGYQYCLRHADLSASGDIEVRFSDLSHFMISQQLSLHHYPTHALSTLSTPHVIPVLDERANRYIELCQAHSRMVLLLQALIHSSLSPVSEELEDPSLRYRNTEQQVGRELMFPAPLSFFSTEEKNRSHALQLTTRRKHIRFFSLPTTFGRSPRSIEGEPTKRGRSRMSMLGRHRVPPPPPSADPIGLKLYAGSWRGWRRAVAASGSASEGDETLFRRPTRHFACTTDSSRSSTNNSSPSPHSSRLTEYTPMSLTAHGPHDIRAVISRFRAPILRVYFPCSELDQGAINACEAQLDDAGLWQHLSVGDVVCNLGYLPSEEDRRGSSSSDLSADGKRGPESWMIFDGMGLVPFTPSAILPLSEPLSLPSPFYYANIVPPPFNPKFTAILPHEEPELSLVLLPARVRSPHSPNGFARIKKYMWLARLGPHCRPGLGEGWHCEWMLEGEGTKEGRQSIVDALCGDATGEREWELVMEKCTTTRIWLRLLSTTPTPHSSESHNKH
ncbi:hypothetical protein EDB86DRAFT_103950 [Lactarius hatsudake]|nr:hypothetical protein EDB86DRAFT_103950 [Lactarius hatsudake]